MKLLTKALIITSLSLAVVTQVQAGGRHDGSGFVKNQDSQYQQRQVGWNSHRDDRFTHREKKIIRHRHGHSHNRAWHHRLNSQYRPSRQYWNHYGRPGHRYDYGHSSGTIIFRW
ncbi:hypothetical protein [Sedimenticola selenatireducens]|uniref:hypothetical protein n=1 Tax=Sedimenticola selenatireducens TaxID=191960 RepID=UPI0012FCF57D|nr:hypothetical protein [Sedimenticola selenatireducens]